MDIFCLDVFTANCSLEFNLSTVAVNVAFVNLVSILRNVTFSDCIVMGSSHSTFGVHPWAQICNKLGFYLRVKHLNSSLFKIIGEDWKHDFLIKLFVKNLKIFFA